MYVDWVGQQFHVMQEPVQEDRPHWLMLLVKFSSLLCENLFFVDNHEVSDLDFIVDSLKRFEQFSLVSVSRVGRFTELVD